VKKDLFEIQVTNIVSAAVTLGVLLLTYWLDKFLYL
jgi:hypothetical protein